MKWLNKNKLSLNLAKTKYMLIKPNIKNFTKTNNFDIHVSGVKLERRYSTKYLGLILDEELTWKPHLHYMQKKLAQGVVLMAKIRKYLSNKNLLSLYYAFFILTSCMVYLDGVAPLNLQLCQLKFFKIKQYELLTILFGKITLIVTVYL